MIRLKPATLVPQHTRYFLTTKNLRLIYYSYRHQSPPPLPLMGVAMTDCRKRKDAPIGLVSFSQTMPLILSVVTFHWCVLPLWMETECRSQRSVFISLWLQILFVYLRGLKFADVFKEDAGLNDNPTAFLWCRFYAQVYIGTVNIYSQVGDN